MDATNGEAVKRARNTFNTILSVLLVGVVISVTGEAFAQGGSISGTVKDLSGNQGIQGVIITVTDVSTRALAGTDITDALGNYSVSIPSQGNYTVLASKLGYDNVTGQDYYVSGVGSTESRGSENIARGTASLTLRLFGRHGIGIKYVASRRDAHYPDIQDRHQTIGTVSIAYTFLGETEFGAVEWRDTDSR